MLEIELFQAPKKSDLRATAIVGDLGGTKARLALYGLLKKSTTPVILARANPLSSEVRSLPELL